MNYNNEKIGNLDNICASCNFSKIGTLIDVLNNCLKKTPREKYNGELLTSAQINVLNNMCPVGNKVSLGTIINNLLSASKNKTTFTLISDEFVNMINNMCGGCNEVLLGTLINELAVIVNDMADDDEAEILTYSIDNHIGVIDDVNATVTVTVPNDTIVSNLIASFTLSEDASAKIGEVEQISGVTENDFTNPVTYIITAEDGVTTKNWTITVVVASE